MENKFTERFIQRALDNFFAINSVKYCIENLFIFNWESDKLLKTKSDYLYEFEIKISKSDFKADFKSKEDKHAILDKNYPEIYIPRYFKLVEETGSKYGEEEKLRVANMIKHNPYFQVCGYKKPNYFYYAVPYGLIDVSEVPEYAGLIYVDDLKRITIVKKAPRLHKDKYSDEELKLASKFYYNMQNWKQKCDRLRINDGVKHDELKNLLKESVEQQTKYKKEISDLNQIIFEQRQVIRKLINKIRYYDPDFDSSSL